MLSTNYLAVLLLIIVGYVYCGNVTFSTGKLTIQVNTTGRFTVNISDPFEEDTTIFFLYQQGENVTTADGVENITPIENLTVGAGQRLSAERRVTGVEVGNLVVLANATSEIENWNDLEMQVFVVHSWPVVIINQIIGWCYFLAWSVSFYPQIVLNFARKSVVGLNFDFILYNLTGFFAYAIFNCAFYFDASILALYEAQHPRSVNPVELNDVIFALHAMAATVLVAGQIVFFERGDQRVSKFCLVIQALLWAFLLISLVVAVLNQLSWLTYIYFFSYCKLVITLIKYVPQAYLNYLRQSTDGWSIGNVLLDFMGGSFSIIQMFLLGYNNDDWFSIFGNPTKFGLGLFSVLFDIVFIVQHYCLYRGNDSVSSGRVLLLEDNEESESLASLPIDDKTGTSVDARDFP